MRASKISSTCHSSASSTTTGGGGGLHWPGNGLLSAGSRSETCCTRWYFTEAGKSGSYAYGDTTLVIAYGPMRRLFRFRLGRLVVMFCAFNQTQSPMLHAGARAC